MKPNILFINVDQQRYDCIGYSRKYPVKTPNIDKLAFEGVWFSNAYTPIPLCCPARQSLLTGRRPEAFGTHWNFDITMKIPGLTPDQYAWPRELGKSGYLSAYVGNWHVSPDYTPTDFGYDIYISNDDYNKFRGEQGYPYKYGFFGQVDPCSLEDSRTHWLAGEAARLMREYSKAGKPWHIRLDFPEPHLPCLPCKEFADLYSPADIPKWGSFDDTFADKPYIQKQQLVNWKMEDYTWEDWAPIVARYYASVSQVDDAIGRVLSALEENGESENTLIVYTSDHGDMCGGHRMIDKHYIMYDDVVHVPFVVKWKGVFDGGRVCDQFIYNYLDFVPTILDLLDIPCDREFEGRSILPLLKGENPEGWRDCVMSTYNGQQFGLYSERMLRTGRWKYVWNLTDTDELYDLENDPDELVNLIKDEDCKQVLADLRRRLYNELKHAKDDLLRGNWLEGQLLEGRKL